MSSLKEAVGIVCKRLKAEFPECKFSVRQDTASMMWAMDVMIMSAPFDAFHKDETRFGKKGYHQLNQYQFDRPSARKKLINNGACVTPELWDTMKRAAEIAIEEYPPDNQMTFVNFAIGRWDRGFVNTHS